MNCLRRCLRTILPAIALLLAGALHAEETPPVSPAAGALKPAFPNYAAVMPTQGLTPRLNPISPADPDTPFAWDQVVVVRESGAYLRAIGAFDPGLQPAQVNLLPVVPTNLTVNGVDAQNRIISVTVKAKTGGSLEILPFQVTARGITSTDFWNLTYDIRGINTRVRGTPGLVRSPGDIIRPGQIVRYTWTQTGRGEKRPKCEAAFVGRTQAATGLTQSTITEVLSVKAQPMVLGHYLMTVTPRDVRGEPARGSTSNGQVFRCAFGSENLAPVTDGLSADSFLPAVGQTITLTPNVVDPETGTTSFDNQTFDFGDGVVVAGVSGAGTHAYAAPGIYRARVTVADDQGLLSTAEDNIIVGASAPDKFQFSVVKQIVPDEAGNGQLQDDTLTCTFKGLGAAPGDRIVFVYNRNRFGRMFESDPSDDTDIVLKPGGFQGPTRLAKNVTVTAGANSISISVGRGSLDRTGDPRFGRADLKGVFKNQRIAVCVIHADGSTPGVLAYTGNVQVKVKGGDLNHLNFVPEESVKAVNTTKEPDPKKQEIP